MSDLIGTSVPPTTDRRALRYVALGSAALFLAASAYQASFAANRLDGYGGGISGDDDDGGSAAIGIGIGVAAIGAIAYYATRDKDDDEDSTTSSRRSSSTDAAPRPPLPEGAQVSGLRLTPGQAEVAPGETRVFDLQARSKADGQWYSVGGRPEATVTLQSGERLVRRMDGMKNVLSVPLDVPASANGQSIEVAGTFKPAGGAALSTASTIRIQTEAAR